MHCPTGLLYDEQGQSRLNERPQTLNDESTVIILSQSLQLLDHHTGACREDVIPVVVLVACTMRTIFELSCFRGYVRAAHATY